MQRATELKKPLEIPVAFFMRGEVSGVAAATQPPIYSIGHFLSRLSYPRKWRFFHHTPVVLKI
jgi:hypothetical protein